MKEKIQQISRNIFLYIFDEKGNIIGESTISDNVYKAQLLEKQIKTLFQETIEQEMPEEIDLRKLTNPNGAGASPQYPFHDKPMVVPVAQAEGFNKAVVFIKSNLLRAIGKAGGYEQYKK